ncbi:MAG: hypothetical protein MMC23_000361 [Stictis urceolatum]|nr:hypothetical protein [Stictis urceolata]
MPLANSTPKNRERVTRAARQPLGSHDQNCGVHTCTNIQCMAFGYKVGDFSKENMLDRCKRMACDFSNARFRGAFTGVDFADEIYYTLDKLFSEGNDSKDEFRKLPDDLLDRFPAMIRALHCHKFKHLKSKDDIRRFCRADLESGKWIEHRSWLGLGTSFEFALRMLEQRDFDIDLGR